MSALGLMRFRWLLSARDVWYAPVMAEEVDPELQGFGIGIPNSCWVIHSSLIS